MATVALIQDDNVANFVLRDMHKELIRQINVDEITIHLISAGMLTDAQQDSLQNSRRGTTDRTKYLLSNEVLGGRGFRGFIALIESLRGNELYKPHLELADRVETCYSSRMRRSQNMRGMPMSVNSQQPGDHDPKTGESWSVAPSSIASHQFDNRSQRGEPTHRNRFQFTSPTGEYLVEEASGVKPRSPSPVTDDGDVYSSCQSELSDDDDDNETTGRRSTDHPHVQGLTEVIVLQKHKSLKNALDMKIILVGNSSVGKTSIIHRYIHGKYRRSVPTYGMGYSYQYVYHPKKNVNIKIFLWDTMGQERHHSITSTFYKNSDAAVIVFDLTSPESLNHVHWWHKELKERVYPERDIPIILAGNKCDMIRHSSIRQPNIMTRARQKAFDLGLKDFIVVSARSGYGMEELLGRIVTLGLDFCNREKSQDTITLLADDTNESNRNNSGSKCPC